MSGFAVGDRVRRSGYVTQRARDYWNNCGREPMKSGAKAALDKAIADRGTVTELLVGDSSRGVSPGLAIQWDDGTICSCLPYMVAKAE